MNAGISSATPRERLAAGARPAALLAALLLAACAAPVRDPWGLAVVRGQMPSKPPVPASLQADLGLQPQARGALPFSTRLYAEPGVRYRLDVFGFPSLLAASWLWQDETWLLVRHDKRQVLSGSGPLRAQADLPLELPDPHAALGFLWGNPLPGFPDSGAVPPGFTADSTGLVRWVYKDEPWEARIDPATGLCREVRSPRLTLRYAFHRKHAGLVVAEQAEIFSGGESLLVLKVRDWVASPPWKKDPFIMKVPEGYERSE